MDIEQTGHRDTGTGTQGQGHKGGDTDTGTGTQTQGHADTDTDTGTGTQGQGHRYGHRSQGHRGHRDTDTRDTGDTETQIGTQGTQVTGTQSRQDIGHRGTEDADTGRKGTAGGTKPARLCREQSLARPSGRASGPGLQGSSPLPWGCGGLLGHVAPSWLWMESNSPDPHFWKTNQQLQGWGWGGGDSPAEVGRSGWALAGEQGPLRELAGLQLEPELQTSCVAWVLGHRVSLLTVTQVLAFRGGWSWGWDRGEWGQCLSQRAPGSPLAAPAMPGPQGVCVCCSGPRTGRPEVHTLVRDLSSWGGLTLPHFVPLRPVDTRAGTA